MYSLNIHIHEYSRILLTKQRIFAINIRFGEYSYSRIYIHATLYLTPNRPIYSPLKINRKGVVAPGPRVSAIVDSFDLGAQILNGGKFSVGYPVGAPETGPDEDDLLLNGSVFDRVDSNPLGRDGFDDMDDGDAHAQRYPGLGSLGEGWIIQTMLFGPGGGYKVKGKSDLVGRRWTVVLDARQEAVTALFVASSPTPGPTTVHTSGREGRLGDALYVAQWYTARSMRGDWHCVLLLCTVSSARSETNRALHPERCNGSFTKKIGAVVRQFVNLGIPEKYSFGQKRTAASSLCLPGRSPRVQCCNKVVSLLLGNWDLVHEGEEYHASWRQRRRGGANWRDRTGSLVVTAREGWDGEKEVRGKGLEPCIMPVRGWIL
ncbi:hypothetical protein DFH08DRAFT_797901 [Mycena albidolilacea]|uniref:Uncharacterized protein n=1 Tax=Mycena albidolilacea TaxID=1033008 RepID=A0AAD7ASN1_9AGAR|nr:hypothetical protein DFH08DRAFT_797901 [Mycena albidolilacea]